MPIVYSEYVPDADALIKTAHIDDPDDRERFLELLQEAKTRPGAAVYEGRTIYAINGDGVTISRTGETSTVAGANAGAAGTDADASASMDLDACPDLNANSDPNPGAVTFHSRPLSRLFKTGAAVYPYVATCGPKMAEFGGSLTDVLEKYWWDVIMIDAVGQARNAMVKEIEQVAGYEPISANPGSIGMWPISNQPALFSLIGDVEEMIGVTIAPSFLMRPLKSISGIYFQGGGGFTHNCCLCERENCPNRRTPFDPTLKAELENEM